MPVVGDTSHEERIAKIKEAQEAGPADARLSSTEAVMVAFASLNRDFLPEDIRQLPADELSKRLNILQANAISAWLTRHISI